MKKALLLVFGIAIAGFAVASDVQLVVQQVDNQGAIPGNTYRVYAQMPDAQHSLHIVFGDMQNPLLIETTAPLYQNPFGGYSANNLSEAAIAVSPTLAYDSYITVGYDNSTNNNMWDIGVDFSDFNQGSNIMTNDGGWFLLPTDAKCSPANNNLILIAQFTTEGVVTGTLNLQGWVGPQEAWQAKGLTFVTTDARVFGCMDATASNYNNAATFDDGTCIGSAPVTTHAAAGHADAVKTSAANSWEIFPNPLRDNLIHIQFKNAVDFKTVSTKVDIIDMNGKLIASQMISADAVLPGNRVTLTQDLAAGSYKVVLTQASKQESQTLIVEK